MTDFFIPKKSTQDHWYKEPWMLLVLGGPVIVVIAAIFTFYLAWHGSDEVVTKDYYKQGVNINQNLYRDAKAAEYKMAAKIQLDAHSEKISLNLSGATALPSSVQMSISSSGNHSEFETVEKTNLTEIQPGLYEGIINKQAVANLKNLNMWTVKLEASDWRLTADWRDPAHNPLQLKP